MTTTATETSTGIGDNFGIEIRVGDRVRVLAWGWAVRLDDVGRIATVTGTTRAGNLTHDNPDVANGRAMRPSCVGVMRRDGVTGYEGNAHR